MSGLGDMFSALDQQSSAALTPPQAKPGGLSSMFDALDRDPQIRATQNLVQAQGTNPDQAAEALKASRVTGIPAPAAEANLQDAKQAAQMKANVDTLGQNPGLTGFVADNPLAARLAQDDFDKLGTIEKLSTALKTGFSEAIETNQLGRLGNIKQLGNAAAVATPDTDKEIAGLQSTLAAQPKLTGLMGGVQNFTGFITGLVDNAIHGLPVAATGAALAGTGGTAIGGVGAGPAALAGGLVGEGIGFNADMARVAAGNAYLKMGQMRGTDGQPMSESGKQFGAIFTGVATYAIGKYATAVESKLLGETAESLAQQAIARAVETPTFTAALKRLAGGTAKGAAQGAAVMTAMEASSVIGEEIGKMASDGTFSHDPQEIIDRLSSAAINGAVLLGTLHGSMKGLGLYGDFRNAQRAEQQAQVFKALLDGSTESRTRERDLGAFQDFMQRQTDGTPVENLFVPAGKIRELYQSMGVDPTDRATDPLFPFVKDMPEQLEQAADRNGDVVISTADFVTHLAGTPVAEHLIPDIRVGADAMSVNEAKAFQKEYVERVKQAVEAAAKGTAPDSQQKIFDLARTQALVAGLSPGEATHNAAIFAARYVTRAARRGLGEDPFELFQKEAPTVEAGTDAETVDQSAGRVRSQETQDLIDARKRHSVLNSIMECIAS